MSLKEAVRGYAYSLGADLVGFGGIERCKHAPIMMSPQGVLPGAKTVVVMAIHHPDACIELGGEEHPQEIGPYSVQYLMNSRLDEMSYRLATYLERQGYGAIPIASSNIWRYNQYKDLQAIFAPDISHIYMAVVAGLADIGFNGLAITPEFGARNRFVTVVTTAEIEQDPLIPPGTVCDKCMLCRRYCPTQALSKEVAGDKVLQIDSYEYRFPNKNLWRCAWGEHFDLDVDLEIPDVVTEDVILAQVKEHGIRGGEMGQCLKFCLPKERRTFERAYSKTPVRRNWASHNEALEPRSAVDRLLAQAFAGGAETILVSTAADLAERNIDIEGVLPGAQTAITLLTTYPAAVDSPDLAYGARYLIDSLCLDLTRNLENLGFRSLTTTQQSQAHITRTILGDLATQPGRKVVANTVYTTKRCCSQQRGGRDLQPIIDYGNRDYGLADSLAALARQLGADLFGIASADRIDDLAEQLQPLFDGEELLDARDRSIRFTPWQPEITTRLRRVKTASDYLPGARSVLVLGLRLHREVVRWATRPPAEAVGPYAFQTYVTNWLGSVLALHLIKHLEKLGYRGVMVRDLMGTASSVANPRGLQPDLRCNRFAALAAGMGQLTVSGHLATPQFGIRQRFIAIVTDAPLPASPLYQPNEQDLLCSDCHQACRHSCPSAAITTRKVTVQCEDYHYHFNVIDGKRCDWSQRYAITGSSGFRFLGSPLDVVPPAEIAPEHLAQALQGHDPIKKYRPVVAQPCVINCPYGNDDAQATPVSDKEAI